MERLRILAIDPGAKCGWAREPEQSGRWTFDVKRDEGEGMRWMRLEKNLGEILDAGVDLVIYESSNFQTSTYAAQVYGAIKRTIHRECIVRGIEYVGVPPADIKRFATGKGNANKEAMIRAAKELFPDIRIVDDNHADALLLWAYGHETYQVG